MCGVIGILGKEDSVLRAVECLARLEYRGYDSCGIATIYEGTLERRRAVGKIVNLRTLLEKEPLQGNIVIGHTRWATHGGVTQTNAHPHINDRIMLIHNGIIENYVALKTELKNQGAVFETQTDTEVVLHLLERFLSEGKTPKEAIIALRKEIQGAYALVIAFKSDPDKLYGLRQGSPLAIGYGEGEMYLGSDAIGLASLTQKIAYLEDGDWVELEHEHVSIFDQEGHQVKREIKYSTFVSGLIGKEGYRHFMLKEIFEQPRVISEVLSHYIDFENKKVRMEFKRPDSINIIACGTSYYAAMVGKYWIEQLSGIPVSVDIASEFRYRTPPLSSKGLSLFISQSGETIDTLEAMKYAKLHQDVGALVNVPESSIARLADPLFPLLAGPEIGVASTKAFIAGLGVLAALALHLSSDDRILDDLSHLPGLMNTVLGLEPQIEAIAQKMIHASTILYLGRGTSFPIALEGALKLKELSYIHAEGFAAGELKHGPIALIDDQTPIIALAPMDGWYEKTLSNIQEVIARGAKVILITNHTPPEGLTEKLLGLIQLPSSNPILSPFLFILPLQLLAYHAACLKGTDVDQPRNLAKSVVVE
jgi:glucosamine--fructose-6-phosphate aminotransferase (isomerizing)